MNGAAVMWSMITGVVMLTPYNSALCYVNGKMISEATTLKTGSRVIFGKSHVFRFTDPQQGNLQCAVLCTVVVSMSC